MGWIFFTLMAAFMQAWRNALQSQLGRSVATSGVTLARFLWASPIAATYLIVLYQWQPQHIPNFSGEFFFYAIGCACSQILATALMVKLFKMNNYAVGAGLAKTEALSAAILGVLFFGTTLSLLGWLGVIVGGIAVMLLSSKGKWRDISIPTILLGIACGSSFAITSLWVREASLTLDVPFPHRAAWVLLWVIGMQTVFMVSVMMWRDRETLRSLFKHTRLTVAISLFSCLGSIGWFSAMSLQNVPYVKTLGQIEVFFMMIVGTFWLKQKPRIKDAAGLVLIAIAAILVLWA